MPRFTALLLISLLSMPAMALAERPNVVILLTDDHGTLDANCYGSTDLITPNIDRLAASGVRFTQAYAHKFCCPARTALLTGRHPQRSGVGNWTQGDRNGTDNAKENMKTEELTIAEALKSAGYDTALFGKWHLGAKLGHGPLDQGFDRFFGHLGGFIDNYRHYFLHGKGFHDLYDGNQEIFRRGEYFPDMMVAEAVKYIDEHKDGPFFMYVAFNLPHYPEQPIGKYADAYADMPMPRQSYARVISTVDDYIGRVLDKLEETGLRENTIVIMMGDNGHSAENNKGIAVENHTSGFPKGHYYLAHGGGGNTGKWIGHKGDYLEGGIRVPAIISYPKALPKGEVRNQIVTVMDWFPTILELAGLPQPEVQFDGHSVLPMIRDANAPTAHKVLHFEWANGWAVRQGNWKLIVKRNKATQKNIHTGLHNLADAQPEVKNYAEEQPDIVAGLTKLHDQWASDVSTISLAEDEDSEAFVGNWALRMDNGDAGWLSIEKVDDQFNGQLWTVGQTKAITNVNYADGKLSFTRQCKIGKPEYPGGPPTGGRVPCDFTATINGDSMRVEMQAATTDATKVTATHTGKRLPPLPPKPDLSKVKFGEPIPLFNGVDLTGWKLSNPKQKNGWKAVNGELVNESPKATFEPFSRYGNLRTEREFGDAKLKIEFNVAANGNSGIYVRGAYEAQVTDRDCKKMQGIRGVGAIFGRIEPTKNAGKPGGEWQSYEITIVDRHATVVLNGETVIDNQPIIGNTNGAYQADVTVPGPLYLQGDHTAVRYRNIVIQPVIK